MVPSLILALMAGLGMVPLSYAGDGQIQDIIYWDTFSRTGALAGSAPALANSLDRKWRDNLGGTAQRGFETNGAGLAADRLDLAGLPLNWGDLPSGATLVVSAEVTISRGWVGFGFAGSNNAFSKTAGAFAWVKMEGNGRGKTVDRMVDPNIVNIPPFQPGEPVAVKIAFDVAGKKASISIKDRVVAEYRYQELPPLKLVFIHGSNGSDAVVRNLKISYLRGESFAVSPAEASELYGFEKPNAPRNIERKQIWILQKDEANHDGGTRSWNRAVQTSVVKKNGAARLVTPSEFARADKFKEADAVIVCSRSDLLDAGLGINRFLKAGGALWLVGLDDYFRPTEGAAADGGIRRLLEGATTRIGVGGIGYGTFQVTKFARKNWPLKKDAIPASRCSYISGNNSIDQPTFPEWVKTEALLQIRYGAKNWINKNDLFQGVVAELIQHQAGPYKGARILYTGLPVDEGLLDPRAVWFDDMVAGNLGMLMAPINREYRAKDDRKFQSRKPPTRADFFEAEAAVFAPLDFNIPENGGDHYFWEDLRAAGFNAVHIGIPWIVSAPSVDAAIDWPRFDGFMEAAKQHRVSVIVDPYSFRWPAFQWTGEQSVHNGEFVSRYIEAIKSVCEKYKDDPTFAGIFATPKTSYGGFTLNNSKAAKAAWVQYLRDNFGSLDAVNGKFNTQYESWEGIALPEPPKDSVFVTSELWAAYVEFHLQATQRLLTKTTESIRDIVPDLPILFRGGVVDASVTMTVAAKFKNVATHCECVETTVDTDGYFRGQSLRLGVPIGAENGWPKARKGPLRMAFASHLLGGYSYFLYSFGGPVWARPSWSDFHTAETASDAIRKARAVSARSSLALLVPDTAFFCYGKRPLVPWAMDDLPHLGCVMERLGLPYECVSAHFPALEGVNVIIDDGRNEVLTAKTAEALTAWIKEGGRLVCFPGTGKQILGGGPSLSERLGISFSVEGEETAAKIQAGTGEVIVMKQLPAAGNRGQTDQFRQLLVDAGSPAGDFELSVPLNQSVLNGPQKKFLVLADKHPRYVSAFFQESTLEKVERELTPATVEIRPKFKFKAVKCVGQEIPFIEKNGAVRITLPPTHWCMLEFTL